MKIVRKTLLGIVLLALGLTVMLARPHLVNAATPASEYWDACVFNVLKGGGNDLCTLNSSSGTPYLTYGGDDQIATSNSVNFLQSASIINDAGGGHPQAITLLNSANQPLFSGDLVSKTATFGIINERAVGNVNNSLSYSKPYWVYQGSGDSQRSFLVTKNSDGSYQMVAMVYDVPQKSPNTSKGTVYAAKINKVMLTQDATGGVVSIKKGDPCTSGADCVSGVCSKTGGDCASTASAAPSCESNFDSGFEWIMCPALNLGDKLAGGFNGFVEDQLCVNTGTTSSTGGLVCKGNDNLNDSVKTAWGIFKNIATAILVIVMLVMVISQAVGGGPFDAYTVRKMLPKLVAAVIIMQLSWVLFKWTIDLSNDLGKGIQSLLYAPFGGESKMQLDKLVANVAQTNTLGTNNTFAFFTVLAAGTAAIANLPGLLTLALFVVVALATAFFVLILRKILILLLIILAPIALIAWILPGADRYWKMWRENFTKLLLMFPMIMGLIAAGRIFAYIVSGGSQPATGSMFTLHIAVAHLGGLPVPYIASVTSFADLAIIVFAYFGPYLMMPKAFSWGGQLMSATANQVNSRVSKPTMDRGREGVKGITERYHGRFGKAYDPNAFIGNRVLNRIGSGHFLPTKRSQRLAIAAGDKWSQERDDQALATIKRRGEKVMVEGYETFVRTDDGQLAKYAKDAAGKIMEDAEGKKITIPVKTKAEAEVKKLSGVQAMKQMWVDLAEEGDSNERKMAVRQLTATSSWPEIQGSFTRSGKRVIDTDAWAPSITTSPEDYPRVLRSRVDATPHIEDGAKKALSERLATGPAMDETQQLRFKSQHRIKYSIESQLDNEGFQTQSDGFWEEAARMATITADMNAEERARALEIQAALKKRFTAIAGIGGTAPMQLLGHLKNGGPLQANVEKALGGESLDTYIRYAGPPTP